MCFPGFWSEGCFGLRKVSTYKNTSFIFVTISVLTVRTQIPIWRKIGDHSMGQRQMDDGTKCEPLHWHFEIKYLFKYTKQYRK
jgi:hypothetical protein